MSTAASTWMGDRLRNTATTEPVDGVSSGSVYLKADGLDMQTAKDPHMSPHAYSTFMVHARPGSDVKRHPHQVLALMTYMC